MSSPNEKVHLLKNIAMITQLGLSIVVPIVGCIWLANYLQNRFRLGGWVMLIGIAVGLLGGISTFASFVRSAVRDAKKSEDGDA